MGVNQRHQICKGRRQGNYRYGKTTKTEYTTKKRQQPHNRRKMKKRQQLNRSPDWKRQKAIKRCEKEITKII